MDRVSSKVFEDSSLTSFVESVGLSFLGFPLSVLAVTVPFSNVNVDRGVVGCCFFDSECEFCGAADKVKKT